MQLTETIPIELLIFTKDDEQRILKQLQKCLESECKKALKDFNADKRLSKFADNLEQKADGSLQRLIENLPNLEWIRQIMNRCIQKSSLNSQIQEQKRYEQMMQMYTTKQEERLRKNQMNQQKRERIKNKKEQEQTKKMAQINIQPKKKQRIKIVDCKNISEQKRRLADHKQTLEQQLINMKEMKPSQQISNKNQNHQNFSKNQLPKHENPIKSNLKARQNIIYDDDTPEVIGQTQQENKQCCQKPLEIEQKRNSSYSNMQEPQVLQNKDLVFLNEEQIGEDEPPEQAPFPPDRRYEQVSDTLRRMFPKLVHCIREQFRLDEQIFGYFSEVQFSQAVSMLVEIYEMKRQKYLQIEELLSNY